MRYDELSKRLKSETFPEDDGLRASAADAIDRERRPLKPSDADDDALR